MSETTSSAIQAAQERAVATRTEGPSTQLAKTIESMKGKIAAAISKTISPDRFVAAVIGEIRRNPKLAQCSTTSFLDSMMKAAQLGLLPSVLGECYLVPFNDKRRGLECQLIIGYQGQIALARRSGFVLSIQAQVVFENDFFEFEFGLDEKLRHKPAQGERGQPVYVYAYAHLRDGGKQYEVLTWNDVLLVRQTAQGARSEFSPWTTHPLEMARKTAIRRLFKYLPKSSEMIAAEVDDADDTPLFTVSGLPTSDPDFSEPYERLPAPTEPIEQKRPVGRPRKEAKAEAPPPAVEKPADVAPEGPVTTFEPEDVSKADDFDKFVENNSSPVEQKPAPDPVDPKNWGTVDNDEEARRKALYEENRRRALENAGIDPNRQQPIGFGT